MKRTADPKANDEAWCSLSNLLSLSRVPLAAALWPARRRPAVLLALIGTAAVTDVLDGWFARRHQPLQQRLGLARAAGPAGRGAWLDPACDKAFVLSLLGVLLVERRLSPRVVALVGLRDLILGPIGVAYVLNPRLRDRMGVDLRARTLGKLTTAAQFLTLGGALLGSRLVPPLAAVAAGLGAGAVIDYAVAYKRRRPR